jgi:hypothetical protein
VIVTSLKFTHILSLDIRDPFVPHVTGIADWLRITNFRESNFPDTIQEPRAHVVPDLVQLALDLVNVASVRLNDRRRSASASILPFPSPLSRSRLPPLSLLVSLGLPRPFTL